MIKKFKLVCFLIVGGTAWAFAQTPQEMKTQDGKLPMFISQLFEKIEDNNKELRTSKTGDFSWEQFAGVSAISFMAVTSPIPMMHR